MTDQPPLDITTLTAEQLIERIVTIERYCDAESKRFKEFLDPQRKHVEEVKNRLRAVMQEQGMDKCSTDSGTAYFSNLLNPKVREFDEYMRFCLANWNEGGSDMLSVGAPKVEAVRSWMESHDGQLPPGVIVQPFSRLNIKSS